MIQAQDRFGGRIVFWTSFVLLLLFVVWGASAPGHLARTAGKALDFVTYAFGWFFLIAVFLKTALCLFLAFSRYGKIRLGSDDDRPEFPFFTWIGMLFSAGFGVGLVFWGVAEPMSHFMTPPLRDTEALSPEAARLAMRYSFFHWGISQWAVFTIAGLTLGYFQFRKQHNSLISSTFRPLSRLADRSFVRHPVDVLAVIATITGVATSLGMGVLQINGGLAHQYGVPNNTAVQLLIIAVLLVLYLLSSTTGLERGIKWLSNLNLGLALLVMLYVFFTGPMVFVLNGLTLGIGDYLQHFIETSLRLTPYKGGRWVEDWTIFYWAWAIAWSPFVGAFVARVSRGRTIREFVSGVLFVPPLIAIVWVATFGGTALHLDLKQGTHIAEAVQSDVSAALFETYAHLPFPALLSTLSLLLILTFLVTSADSATFVLGMMTTGGNPNPGVAVKLVWGVLMAAVAAVLLLSSGLEGLQTASLVAALPFTLIMLVMCASLLRSLKKEKKPAKPEKKHAR